VITYRQLLDIFFDNHLWSSNSSSRQYWNVAFYHDEEQKQVIQEKVRQLEEEEQSTVKTKVLPVTAFYYAEDYHQKWELRKRSELADLFRGKNLVEFADSPLAAKLNAYVGGSLTAAEVEEMLDSLHLDEEEKRQVQSALKPSPSSSSASKWKFW